MDWNALYSLNFKHGYTGTHADTPDSMDDPDSMAPDSPPEQLVPPDSPPDYEEQGRHRAVAAVRTMDPSALLAKISAPITQKTSEIISDVRSLYAVPDGDQAPGLDSDGYRVSLKRKVADISRSQYEAYSFATKHNLSEAAVEELLGMLSNVCT